MAKYLKVTHGFGPFFDENSELLILGSFPSVKSREQQFFYGHPMNRFWPLLSRVFGEAEPKTIEEKKNILSKHRIALYDVIEECEIKGSSDASIRNPIVSDLVAILSKTKVRKVILNGKKAGKLFEKYQAKLLNKCTSYVILPSTSPANAAVSLDELVRAWAGEL